MLLMVVSMCHRLRFRWIDLHRTLAWGSALKGGIVAYYEVLVCAMCFDSYVEVGDTVVGELGRSPFAVSLRKLEKKGVGSSEDHCCMVKVT